MQDRMFFFQPDEVFDIRKDFLSRTVSVPLDPARFIILAIGIVISKSGIAEFVPAIDQRGSLCHKKHGQSVFHLPSTQLHDSFLTAGALTAAVPCGIAVIAIPIIFAVSLVMFLFIGHHVRQCKSVVVCHVIDNSMLFWIFSLQLQEKPQHIVVSF